MPVCSRLDLSTAPQVQAAEARLNGCRSSKLASEIVGIAIMPMIQHLSFCLVPEKEAAQACLILPLTPFTLTTGLATCR